MTRRILAGLVAVGAFLVICVPAQAVTVYLTTTSAATIGSGAAAIDMKPGDIVAYDTATETATMFFVGKSYFRNANGTTGDVINIDALHVLPDGRFYLSTASAARLGKSPNMLSFKDGDVVLFDPAQDVATLIFSESKFRKSNGASGGDEDIDALHILANGHIVFSTRSGGFLLDANSNVLSFKPGDLVEYDPVADAASIFLKGVDHFRTAGGDTGVTENIDGVSVLPDGSLLLTTEDGARLGDPLLLSFTHGDVVRYYPPAYYAQMFLSHEIFSLHCAGENVDGLSILMIGGDPLEPIPEPVTAATFALAAAGLAGYLRRRRAA